MLAILMRVQSEDLVSDHPVTGTNYRLDFAYPALRLGIETHGLRWHFGEERWKRDLRRDRRLAQLGWEILYFSWDDVHLEPGRVEQEVRGFLRERAIRAVQ